MLLLALTFFAILITIEERIIEVYKLDPLLVMAASGFWGCLFSAIALPAF